MACCKRHASCLPLTETTPPCLYLTTARAAVHNSDILASITNARAIVEIIIKEMKKEETKTPVSLR